MKAFGRQFENRQREADAESAFADTMGELLGLGDEPNKIKQPTTIGKRAGIDANAGHDSGGTVREISGASRHGSENPYAELARSKKVKALLLVLRVGLITAEEASRMTSSQWAEVASAAKVNMPSAETRERVLAELCESEETF